MHDSLSGEDAEGVNTEPIFSIELNSNIEKEKIDALVEYLPDKFKRTTENGSDVIVFYREANGVNEAAVYRNISIYRFDTTNSAQSKYLDYKRLFTDRSDNWKLYKEDGSDDNKYFSSYKKPWMDTNHGVPVGVVTHPEIMVVNLKMNLLVCISYTSYRDDGNYVHEINDDISYVGNLIRKAYSNPSPNPALKRDAPAARPLAPYMDAHFCQAFNR